MHEKISRMETLCLCSLSSENPTVTVVSDYFYYSTDNSQIDQTVVLIPVANITVITMLSYINRLILLIFECSFFFFFFIEWITLLEYEICATIYCVDVKKSHHDL